METLNPVEKLPLSVVMTSSNNARDLPFSLGSVREWAAEIIVVINDCTDDTRVVAEQQGAIVHEHAWTNFRDQKNLALGHATQPWILGLDSDEAVSLELRQSITQLIHQNDPAVSGARFARTTWFLNRWIRHGEWYPDYCLRLFRRGLARWEGSEEHDAVALPGAITLAGDLLHVGFPDVLTHLRKTATFSETFLRQQTLAGKKWKFFDNVFRPLWRFFRCYILRRGFLDGFPGLIIAVNTAHYTFVRYNRLYERDYRRDPVPPA
jgi:glycosyltransferase involved in cell wall biosynthesis